MRHLKTVKTMNRTKSHKRALLQNLANSLFDHESIQTTNPKAMELKKVADRLITLAKRKDMHAMRLAFAFLRDKEIVKKLFSDIGDRYAATNGGYTRVLKIGRRKGDNAPMAIIELTQKREKEKAKEVKPAKETKKEKRVKKEKKEEDLA
jgi:large subunit ribosomal protein L17